MNEFEPLNLPWEMIDTAQRRKVTEYGYESPPWLLVRRWAELWMYVWSDLELPVTNPDNRMLLA